MQKQIVSLAFSKQILKAYYMNKRQAKPSVKHILCCLFLIDQEERFSSSEEQNLISPPPFPSMSKYKISL